MKKVLCLILALTLVCSLFVGCEKKAELTEDEAKGNVEVASDLAYIQENGKLIVGITDFEPMDYKGEDGEWTGFDAELARLVGERLGVEVEFQLIEWAAKETELASKNIDCIWNGLTWDEERAENMSLSDHYMLNRQVVVVSSKNAEDLSADGALDTAIIAAESGSAGESFIEETYPDAEYIEKSAQIDVLTELLSGNVDAGVLDYIMANYLINKEGSDFSTLKILEDVAEAPEEFYSVAFRKGSDVTAEVNAILAELKADSSIDEIAAKYGLTDTIVK